MTLMTIWPWCGRFRITPVRWAVLRSGVHSIRNSVYIAVPADSNRLAQTSAVVVQVLPVQVPPDPPSWLEGPVQVEPDPPSWLEARPPRPQDDEDASVGDYTVSGS